MSAQDIMGLIAAGVGIIVSLMTTYLPVVAQKFYALPDGTRGFAMLGMNVVASLAIFGLSCTNLFSWVPCSTEGIMLLFKTLMIMVATNQLVYMVTPVSPTKQALDRAQLTKYAGRII